MHCDELYEKYFKAFGERVAQEDSHLISRTKSSDELIDEKIKVLKDIKAKVISKELSLEEASTLVGLVNASYDFYDARNEIKGRHR